MKTTFHYRLNAALMTDGETWMVAYPKSRTRNHAIFMGKLDHLMVTPGLGTGWAGNILRLAAE